MNLLIGDKCSRIISEAVEGALPLVFSDSTTPTKCGHVAVGQIRNHITPTITHGTDYGVIYRHTRYEKDSSCVTQLPKCL